MTRHKLQQYLHKKEDAALVRQLFYSPYCKTPVHDNENYAPLTYITLHRTQHSLNEYPGIALMLQTHPIGITCNIDFFLAIHDETKFLF